MALRTMEFPPLKRMTTSTLVRLFLGSCTTDILVMTRWKNRTVAVPLSQLKAIGVDESTTQAIEDWHYWVAQGNCF
jgi:hypothetical protein